MVLGTERPIFKTINKAHGRAPAYAYLTGVDAVMWKTTGIAGSIVGTAYTGMLDQVELRHVANVFNGGGQVPQPELQHLLFPNIGMDVLFGVDLALNAASFVYAVAAIVRGAQTAGTFAIDNTFNKKKS